MRGRTLQLASILLLIVVFGSHLSELLDTWDNTFQSGNDIESSLVIAALTLGAALALMSATVLLLLTTSPSFPIECAKAPVLHQFSGFIDSTHSPPLIPLRI